MLVCWQKKVWWKDFWWNKRTLMRDFAQLQTELQLFPLTIIIWENSQQTNDVKFSNNKCLKQPANVTDNHGSLRASKKNNSKKKDWKKTLVIKQKVELQNMSSLWEKKLTRFTISHVINALPASFTQQCALHRLHRCRHSRTLDLIQTVLRFYFLKFLLIWWWWNENFHLLIEYTTSLSSFLWTRYDVRLSLSSCCGRLWRSRWNEIWMTERHNEHNGTWWH